jgi:hypothetical protein
MRADNERRLGRKCRELGAELLAATGKLAAAAKLSEEDTAAVATLKRELDKAWKGADASAEKAPALLYHIMLPISWRTCMRCLLSCTSRSMACVNESWIKRHAACERCTCGRQVKEDVHSRAQHQPGGAWHFLAEVHMQRALGRSQVLTVGSALLRRRRACARRRPR